MPRRALRHVGLLAGAAALAACIDIAAPPDIGGGRLIGISMTSDAVVEVGDTVRLAASGNVSGIIGMLAYDPLPDAEWAVSDTTVARVERILAGPEDSIPYARARLTGVRPGVVQVAVTARGVRGEAPARVVPVVARIALRASRDRDTLAVGDRVFVSATPLDADGQPTTGPLPLVFEPAGGIVLDGYSTTGAFVVATAPGPATLSARFRRAAGQASLVVVLHAP
jgi:hypothetical protein